jgi:hypothetical protein
MATMTLEISTQFSRPPSQSGWLSIAMAYGASHTFTVANFTTETTPEYVADGVLSHVKVSTLPVQGALLLSSVAVTVDQEISATDISASNLVYTSNTISTAGYSDGNMTFLVSDVVSGLYNSVAEQVIFKVGLDATVNQEPTEVGDVDADVTLGTTVILTRAMLTENYSDPEGDAADKLKIVELASFGTVKLNGSPVYINQEINFTDIDSGLLTYESTSIPGNGESEKFEFEISDSGSGNFVG